MARSDELYVWVYERMGVAEFPVNPNAPARRLVPIVPRRCATWHKVGARAVRAGKRSIWTLRGEVLHSGPDFASECNTDTS